MFAIFTGARTEQRWSVLRYVVALGDIRSWRTTCHHDAVPRAWTSAAPITHRSLAAQMTRSQHRYRVATGVIGLSLVLMSCVRTVASEEVPEPVKPTAFQVNAPESPAAPRTSLPTDAPSSSPAPAPTGTTTTTTSVTTSTTPAPTTIATTTTTTTATTTIVVDPLAGVFDRSCVVQTVAGGSFEQVAIEQGGTLDVTALWAENGFVDSLAAGALVDVCVDNSVDDVTGASRPRLDATSLAEARRANIERQQTRLNELFAGYGTAPLAVDGDSGPLTGQRLCAARLALGLAVSVDDMQPGSDEHAVLFATTELPTPASSAVASERWVLIDRTCQMMFIGTGPETVYIFPTSTGSEGFETRDQDRARVFRFNPATENGGWHNSSEFPVGVDNPLNGNLYKPLYFDLGQAIHGANNVPPYPQSKGCARLTVADQTTLLAWLGLDGLTEETWVKSEINLTVNVQGQFIGR
jgi:hypothetical protein